MQRIKDIMNFNLGVYGPPALMNKDELGDRFYIDEENIVELAASYFIFEPEKWAMPAKNYFVRLCIAKHLEDKGFGSFYELLDDNGVLPYDDRFSKSYHEAKETYEAIMARSQGDWKKMAGYQKTIEIFGYLYEPILKPVTIGYNCSGQDFFDLISFKKKHILEYYFSLYHTMRQHKLDPKEELRKLGSCNTYGIPGNLLMNTNEEESIQDELLRSAMALLDLQSVSVLTLGAARRIKERFPQLKIHLSTHGSFNVKPEEFALGYFDVLNISEPWQLKQKDIIQAAWENGVKIKYIVNRGCVVNKMENMSKLFGCKINCCHHGKEGDPLSGCDNVCGRLAESMPWLKLTHIDIPKEVLAFRKDIDILKISTRENPLSDVKSLLDYWTSYKPTKNFIGVDIRDYAAFVDWAKFRTEHCIGDCKKCLACKYFYKKITQNLRETPDERTGRW